MSFPFSFKNMLLVYESNDNKSNNALFFHMFIVQVQLSPYPSYAPHPSHPYFPPSFLTELLGI